MSTVEFSASRFLRDVETAASMLGAPHSAPMTRRVLDAYEESFRRGAVLWHTTDKPGSPLNQRCYARRPVDTMRIAVQAGCISAHPPAAGLISAWSSLNEGSRELRDFDTAQGLVKTRVYPEGVRPVAGDSRHMKAERSYCGRPVALMHDCASPMTVPVPQP